MQHTINFTKEVFIMDPIGIFFMFVFLILVLVAVIYPQLNRNGER
jgi:hypothetical protein